LGVRSSFKSLFSNNAHPPKGLQVTSLCAAETLAMIIKLLIASLQFVTHSCLSQSCHGWIAWAHDFAI